MPTNGVIRAEANGKKLRLVSNDSARRAEHDRRILKAVFAVSAVGHVLGSHDGKKLGGYMNCDSEAYAADQ